MGDGYIYNGSEFWPSHQIPLISPYKKKKKLINIQLTLLTLICNWIRADVFIEPGERPKNARISIGLNKKVFVTGIKIEMKNRYFVQAHSSVA